MIMPTIFILFGFRFMFYAEHWNKFFNKTKLNSMQDMTVDKVWLTDTAVWIHTTDGKRSM